MNTKENKGITLIALVITIIVLLILAGVAIATITGENGLLNRAQSTIGIADYRNAEEQVRLAYMNLETELKVQKATNSNYNVQNNAGKLAKLLKRDLSGSEWSVKLGNSEVTSSTPDDTSGTTITITYTKDSIIANEIEQGKPLQSGKIDCVINISEQGTDLIIDTNPTVNPPAQIHFTIAGTEYTAEQGMNWGQWCSSSYNTIPLHISPNDYGNQYIVRTDLKGLSLNGEILTSNYIDFRDITVIENASYELNKNVTPE